MIKLSEIAKRYDLSEKDFELTYYSALNNVRRISGKFLNEDLLFKYMYDKLEEQGLKPRDVEKVIEYYQEELAIYQSKKEEKAIKKIMSGEDAQEVVEEEMQTSNNTGMDTAIGRNKKHGYSTQVIDMYSETEDSEDSDLP